MKFFTPTADLKELLLLQHIEGKSNTTQHEMAKVIDGAASMVNLYLDRLEENGYIKRDYKSSKIVYYHITQQGIKRKNYLLINYMRELLDLYRLAKANIEKFLSEVKNRGNSNILIYGAGEVAKTILAVIRDRNDDTLNVVAVVDDNKCLQDKEILGFKIISRRDIGNYEHDAIVITSYSFEDEIRQRLKELNYSEDKVINFFS